MPEGTRHIGIHINRSWEDVYAYASDPVNMPDWAAGLGDKIEKIDGEYYADGPMGRLRVRFAPTNEYGVLDHEVQLADGQTFHNPMRVIPDEGNSSEVVFSVRRFGDISDDDFDRDARLVAADLERLKQNLEQ